MKATLSCAALLAALAAACAAPAAAHVTANPHEGEAGAYFQTGLRISHGCEGADTTAVHVMLPETILSARPQFKPGWTATVVTRKLDKPVPGSHGKMVAEKVTEIVWRGGPLPDGQYDEFGILTKLPAAPGTVLYFPVTQECADGRQAWDQIPAAGQSWGSLAHPAPFVKILPGASR